MRKANSKAEKLCSGVRPDIKGQAVTLANAIMAMQDKIEQQITFYKETDLYQEVTTNSGDIVLKQNPVSQEFRATVKDYSSLLKDLQNMLSEKNEPTQMSDMAELRKKFKIAK